MSVTVIPERRAPSSRTPTAAPGAGRPVPVRKVATETPSLSTAVPTLLPSGPDLRHDVGSKVTADLERPEV